MRAIDIIRRASLNLRQAKVRTILTSLGISVGAFTITIALAAGAAGRDIANTLTSSAGDEASLSVYRRVDQEVVVSAGPPKLDAEPNEQQADSLTDEDIEIIEGLDGVERVVPQYYVSADYMTRDGQDKYLTSLTIKVDRTELQLAAGELSNNMLEQGQVAIPDTFLEALGFNDAAAAIDQVITLRVTSQQTLEGQDMNFSIAAVYTQTQETLYFDKTVYLSIEDGKDVYQYQSMDQAGVYSGFKVQAALDADVSQVQSQLERTGDYVVYSMRDDRAQLMSLVNVMQWGLVGVGAIAILASIFGIINTQYISVLERTREIGLMKSLGMRRRDIAKMFRYEAAWVGLLGGLIGTILALVAGLLNPLVVEFLKLEAGTKLLLFEPLTSLALIAGLIIVAIMAGYFPSRKAARLDPVEALKYE